MATSPLPEDDIIAQAVAGDPWSLETLLIQYHDPLLHFIATRLTRHHPPLIPAEDVLQETMMEAFRSIRKFSPRGSIAFFAWLKTIARTRFFNLLEAQQAKKRGGDHKRLTNGPPADATAVSLLARIAGQDPTPSWIARRKEVLNSLTDAISMLDEPRRQIVDLRYRQGLAIEEIAVRLGRTEGAVKMSLNRAIRELREDLSKNFGESSIGT